MAKVAKTVLTPEQKAQEKARTWNRIKKDKWMYLLLLPGIVYFILFKFAPMWGVLIAFKDYYAGVDFINAPWVGVDNFVDFFTDSSFGQLLRNTLIISGMNLVFYFPLPIIISLLLNEIKVKVYKNVIQTLIYVPHFVSMVVIASITFMLLKVPSMEGYTGGAIYEIIKGITGRFLLAHTLPEYMEGIRLGHDHIPCCTCGC